MVIDHFVRYRVDFVDPVGRVDVVARSDGGRHEGCCERVGGVAGGTVVRVEDAELVLVRVAKEDVRKGVRRVAGHDLVPLRLRGHVSATVRIF